MPILKAGVNHLVSSGAEIPLIKQFDKDFGNVFSVVDASVVRAL